MVRAPRWAAAGRLVLRKSDRRQGTPVKVEVDQSRSQRRCMHVPQEKKEGIQRLGRGSGYIVPLARQNRFIPSGIRKTSGTGDRTRRALIAPIFDTPKEPEKRKQLKQNHGRFAVFSAVIRELDRTGDIGARVRAVLHHQGGRQGYWTRLESGLRICPAVERISLLFTAKLAAGRECLSACRDPRNSSLRTTTRCPRNRNSRGRRPFWSSKTIRKCARHHRLRTQSARHRLDHGTICGRSDANSGRPQPTIRLC
jgi:hypothetical protein